MFLAKHPSLFLFSPLPLFLCLSLAPSSLFPFFPFFICRLLY